MCVRDDVCVCTRECLLLSCDSSAVALSARRLATRAERCVRWVRVARCARADTALASVNSHSESVILLLVVVVPLSVVSGPCVLNWLLVFGCGVDILVALLVCFLRLVPSSLCVTPLLCCCANARKR